VLGQRLRRIVAYVEGYPAEGEPVRRTVGVGFQAKERVQGGIREEVVQVCRVVYGKRGECWQFPRGWQHSVELTRFGGVKEAKRDIFDFTKLGQFQERKREQKRRARARARTAA
jgi:hypothetical protein